MKAGMVCWHGKGTFLPLNVEPYLCRWSYCLCPPLYMFCLFAFFSLSFLPTSPPLHLQFQPFVQLVGRGGQEAGGGSPSERQVQRTHLSDSAVRQEEEQHPAAAAQ